MSKPVRHTESRYELAETPPGRLARSQPEPREEGLPDRKRPGGAASSRRARWDTRCSW